MTAVPHRRAGLLLYAAIQFVLLTAIAMGCYPGGTVKDPTTTGYAFAGNFFSDLGATRSWSGASNHTSVVLFGIALITVGLALAAFAGTWRMFAFSRGRARVAGIAAQVFGTISGAGFIAIAVTPVNRALELHNAFVITAFGMLLGYAASMTVVWWRNGATLVERATSTAYVLLVCAYIGSIAIALRTGVSTPRGITIMVVSQKIIVYLSMLYVVYLSAATRRLIRA